MKDLWMYLLPSGFLASLLTWLVNRRRERLKDIREEHTVYRDLYEDLRALIKKQDLEYGKLREKLYKLEKTLEDISICRYRRQCPLLERLQYGKSNVGNEDASRNEDAPARGDPVAGN